ncbi:threonine aldolase family protein [Williamsia sp.]|uniref:threonine aldolase family protein n=1 Tax=Williamsia sp. TaxID=1872085 RepID=UPI002F95B10A
MTTRPEPAPQLHDPQWRAFASDNYAGMLPEVVEALVAANGGHQPSYGDDAYTRRLRSVVRGEFGARAEVFPVFNGTAANVVSLTAMLPRWGAAIVAESAHVHNDEGGAPERVSGIKLLTVPTADGKLTPESIATQAYGFGDVHRAQPLAVSLTQSTELGTLYSVDEIVSICEYSHKHRMLVHVDGARLWNAAAALGLSLGEFTSAAGVDVVSLGGTKTGAMGAEAVVVLDPDSVSGTDYIRKFSMQLSSKMRFISAQLVALFEGDTALDAAANANAMATRLRGHLEGTPGLTITVPTQANAVFAMLDPVVAERVRETWKFYTWDDSTGEVRWMCSFDTTASDVDAFAAAIKSELAAG